MDQTTFLAAFGLSLVQRWFSGSGGQEGGQMVGKTLKNTPNSGQNGTTAWL